MSDWIIIGLSAVMAAMLPDATIGAAIGSLFYLLSAKNESGVRKVLLCLIGFAAGYALAQPFQEGHWVMLVAILGSAFSVSVLLQIADSFTIEGNPAPPFVSWLLEWYIKIRGR